MTQETQTGKQSFEFQAEVRQLLDILSHSLYTHRDVFIRELISNATDALDKARFKSVKNEEMADSELSFEINIELDKDKNQLKLSDTGIGMTHDELVENLGTIARSGTTEFIKQAAQNKEDISLIGRFGVGFYSVFMAAETVKVHTKSAEPGTPSWTWISDGTGKFEIEEGPHDMKRGTTVVLQLREDAKDFAEESSVKSIIEKYSNFIPFSIKVNGEQVNTVSAIWREPKSNIKTEQYNEFYKFISHKQEDALTWMHFSADVPLQFHTLFFVPKTNLEFMGFEAEDEGIQLFVRRVLVDPHNSDILPNYLRFLRGVIESDDLPLNISRETLQENAHMIKIKNTVVSKFLAHLQNLADKEPETYTTFWRQHGRIFKEGYNDYANKDKVASLFRFNSSACETPEDLVSLDTYIERMPENQEEIYYLSGPDYKTLNSNPNLEIFKAKDVEVLYCYDPIDEFALPGLFEYKGKQIVSADTVDMTKLEKLPDLETKPEPEGLKASQSDLDKLARRIKDILGDRVEDVKISERLVDSPAVLRSDAMSSQMEKMMKIYTQDNSTKPKTMEINKKHPLIHNLLAIYQKNAKDPVLNVAVENLFNSVSLLDGSINDPQSMADSIQNMISQSLDLYNQQPGSEEK
ncbi:MAG: molecular chaperone HtpG [candidate division KSB1 bacterium]|nr:molecular chaperone HtpG [candidate division KSB1 bacterium]